jgi:hypothetical protein
LASNFNNDLDRSGKPGGVETSAVAEHPRTSPEPAPSEPTAIVSDAVIKFRSCRWRRPPDEGVECCGHRDVLPLAGTNSFDPEAWCPDCAYFKLRRSPKKRMAY